MTALLQMQPYQRDAHGRWVPVPKDRRLIPPGEGRRLGLGSKRIVIEEVITADQPRTMQ